MNRLIVILSFIIVNVLSQDVAMGQEHEGGLLFNPRLFSQPLSKKPVKKATSLATTPLELPFFEDFTGYGIYPDSSKWQDNQVYINNTMGFNPISRGVATFDVLDSRGIPYDSFNNYNIRYCDSLTSQPIDLSLNTVGPGDSVYFSFFYQPQGNSYYPLIPDSLILYFRTKFGGFEKVWSAQGSNLQPFKQILIPITDSVYFDSFFQFRFVNIGAMNSSDAVWNVDYIRLNRGRNQYDTILNDVGFASDPSFLLNDYTSMPYRQFDANKGIERAGQYIVNVRNNYAASQSVVAGYKAIGVNTNDILQDVSWLSPLSIPPLSTQPVVYGSYNTTIDILFVGTYDRVVFRNTYFIQSLGPGDPPDNDTVVKDMVFDNYLAYDDGTAEKSYYLNLYPTLPGKIGIEYHLNKPDTMKGMAIYFGRQVPFATNKLFSIKVYSALQGVLGAAADVELYSEDACFPGYVDSINQFWIYKFARPVPLPAGLFYAGTFQPAESGSDSLYFGLDVNRVGSNHTYFNVSSGWTPSLISGAIMMRPLLGQDIVASAIDDVEVKKRELVLSPNPADDLVKVDFGTDVKMQYTITDLRGRKVMQGEIYSGKTINIAALQPGMYFVNVAANGQPAVTGKLLKR